MGKPTHALIVALVGGVERTYECEPQHGSMLVRNVTDGADTKLGFYPHVAALERFLQKYFGATITERLVDGE